MNTAASPNLGLPAADNWRNPAVRLARRITFGVNKAELDAVRRRGFQGYLDDQLNFEAIDDSACEALIAQRYPRYFNTAPVNWSLGGANVTHEHLTLSLIHRYGFSRRQLYWRMVEFWLDHFNVWFDKGGPHMLTDFVRDAVARHAMGLFPNLLRSVAQTGSMMNYLDNEVSWGADPNLNYARELLELHTLGVDGGYTERDVEQAALVLTGWSREDHVFKYKENFHTPGDKRVLGFAIPSAGFNEGVRLLSILSRHMNTGRFLARKLCRFFLGAELPRDQIDAIARVFVSSKGDVRAMLRLILTPANVMASPPKFKRPMHYVVSAIRSSRPVFNALWPIEHHVLADMGHRTFYWQPPDGYPDTFDYWSAGMASRIDFAMKLPNNGVLEMRTDIMPRYGQPRDATAIATKINTDYFAGEGSTPDRNALLAYLQAGLITDERVRGAVALAIASPSFQWF